MQILLYICNMGRSYFLMTEKEEWRKKKESTSPSGEEKEDEGRGIAAVTSVWTTRQLTHVCSFLYRIYSQRFVGWTYRNQLFATGAYDSNSSIAVSFLFPSPPFEEGEDLDHPLLLLPLSSMHFYDYHLHIRSYNQCCFGARESVLLCCS